MRRKQERTKHYRNHSLAAAIIGLVSTTVSSGTGIAGMVVQKKAKAGDQLYNTLYSPVYLSGKTFTEVKNSMYTSYQKNPTIFRQYFDEWELARKSDLENGTHPSQKFQVKHYIIMAIVVVMAFVVFRILTK